MEDGNCQFLVDEAHTTGVFGNQGRGYVNQLGVEKDVAIRMHTYGKAMACTGGESTQSDILFCWKC
jgi:8-amino-7-oxononanoate synthase